MVRAYHVIFCAYGFWLPNDPRGSWSDFVRSWELLRFGKATKQLKRERLHPFGQLADPPWARGCWKVFLNTEAAIRRAIRYVEQNPVKEGKPLQHWSFVTPFTHA